MHHALAIARHVRSDDARHRTYLGPLLDPALDLDAAVLGWLAEVRAQYPDNADLACDRVLALEVVHAAGRYDVLAALLAAADPAALDGADGASVALLTVGSWAPAGALDEEYAVYYARLRAELGARVSDGEAEDTLRGLEPWVVQRWRLEDE